PYDVARGIPERAAYSSDLRVRGLDDHAIADVDRDVLAALPGDDVARLQRARAPGDTGAREPVPVAPAARLALVRGAVRRDAESELGVDRLDEAGTVDRVVALAAELVRGAEVARREHHGLVARGRQ